MRASKVREARRGGRPGEPVIYSTRGPAMTWPAVVSSSDGRLAVRAPRRPGARGCERRSACGGSRAARESRHQR